MLGIQGWFAIHKPIHIIQHLDFKDKDDIIESEKVFDQIQNFFLVKAMKKQAYHKIMKLYMTNIVTTLYFLKKGFLYNQDTFIQCI